LADDARRERYSSAARAGWARVLLVLLYRSSGRRRVAPILWRAWPVSGAANPGLAGRSRPGARRPTAGFGRRLAGPEAATRGV